MKNFALNTSKNLKKKILKNCGSKSFHYVEKKYKNNAYIENLKKKYFLLIMKLNNKFYILHFLSKY